MHKRVCLIPLDGRPVCSDLPRRLAAAAGIELSLPSPAILGVLKKPADFMALKRWIKNHLFENDPVIVALDTIAYGGLIPSRISEEPLKVLQSRIVEFYNAVEASHFYGFSSILRIPNYNNAEEEPKYWSEHGRALYNYSVSAHQNGTTDSGGIPQDVLDNFLARREKNHALNVSYLDDLAVQQLDYLTFCQDDTGTHGINVLEAKAITNQINSNPKFKNKAHVQTGADEVASVLFSRWLCESFEQTPSIFPLYTSENGASMIARFDGKPISEVVERQIEACGGKVVDMHQDANLILLVHTPENQQGDHCENINSDTTEASIAGALQTIQSCIENLVPLTIADVACANGSDPKLMQPLISRFTDLTPLYGYAGWNTPGNTIGSAVAMGIVRYLAELYNQFNPEEFNKLLMTRLGDDWLYQADVRYTIKKQSNGKPPSNEELSVQMAGGLGLLKSKLGLENTSISCRFPCNRPFEIEMLMQ